MRYHYRFIHPPRALRRPGIQLDNFSLVPASLLGDMSNFQAIADGQPAGTAVLVLPSAASPLRHIYNAIARVLKERGKTIRLYSASARSFHQ